GWLIEELAGRRPVNEIVGSSVLVQLLDKPDLIGRLARFLAKNQEPVAPVWMLRRDKQKSIGERLGALEMPDSDPWAPQRLLRFPPFVRMLAEVCGFLNLPGAVLFFEAILDILWKRSHVAGILTLASTSCLLTEKQARDEQEHQR